MAVKVIRSSGWRWSWGIMVLALAVLVFLSLASFRPDDITVNKIPANTPALNFIGPAGAWMAYLLLMGFGVGAYIFAGALLVLGLFMVFQHEGRVWPKALWLLVITLMFSSLFELASGFWASTTARLNIGPDAGGALGRLLTHDWLVYWMGTVGTVITAMALMLVGLFFVFDWHPMMLAQQGASGGKILLEKWQSWRAAKRDDQERIEVEQRDVAKRRRRLEEALKDNEKAAGQPALPLTEDLAVKPKA
ncbi:MAG: DNA translocase FtsK 4TM domain-containing protein, partial [Kiritimatiellaeota bacterium]|nr:DNA translocase FtsK 4TM domain-containing protein [Kiritimatiellota bacterium]